MVVCLEGNADLSVQSSAKNGRREQEHAVEYSQESPRVVRRSAKGHEVRQDEGVEDHIFSTEISFPLAVEAALLVWISVVEDVGEDVCVLVVCIEGFSQLLFQVEIAPAPWLVQPVLILDQLHSSDVVLCLLKVWVLIDVIFELIGNVQLVRLVCCLVPLLRYLAVLTTFLSHHLKIVHVDAQIAVEVVQFFLLASEWRVVDHVAHAVSVGDLFLSHVQLVHRQKIGNVLLKFIRLMLF